MVHATFSSNHVGCGCFGLVIALWAEKWTMPSPIRHGNLKKKRSSGDRTSAAITAVPNFTSALYRYRTSSCGLRVSITVKKANHRPGVAEVAANALTTRSIG
jgi:hypothetical protein